MDGQLLPWCAPRWARVNSFIHDPKFTADIDTKSALHYLEAS
uniref:Uncharacterized protein n=1 Tax=Arundo donax TaxID=35708 RepID=A0A0A9H3T9_ARUDO